MAYEGRVSVSPIRFVRVFSFAASGVLSEMERSCEEKKGYKRIEIFTQKGKKGKSEWFSLEISVSGWY